MPPAPGVDPLSLLSRLESLGIRLGLEKTRELLAALGDPQKSFPAVLIAGTNGKGSTSALLAAMVQAAGYRTGLYTSPYLEDVREEIRVDGRSIAPETLSGRLAAVMDAAGALALPEPPTVFEAMTAAAFLHFAETSCDLAVVEVGMGGLRDATNAADPVLSILTSVGLDHCAHLGPDLATIAAEKAGILRPGRPGLIGSLPAEAEAAVRSAAGRIGARISSLSEGTKRLSVEPLGWAGQRVVFETPRHPLSVDLPFLGEHQVENLLLAALAAESLRDLGWTRLTPEAVARGASACRWPGRLEPVELPGGFRVLLDAAHNPQGIEALCRFLDSLEEPFDLLFGVLSDKDAGAMLPPLVRRARRVWLTSPGGPRAVDPAAIAPLMSDPPPEIEPRLASALDRALAGPPVLLVVCGSARLVGQVRRRLRESHGVPEPAHCKI